MQPFRSFGKYFWGENLGGSMKIQKGFICFYCFKDESSVINDSKQFMMKSLASDAPTVIEPVNNANHRFGVSASMEWNQS